MNQGPLIFVGLLAAMASSWCGMIFAPQLQLGRQETVSATGGAWPPARPGLANQGRELYRANGCFYCHTQQVGPRNLTSDLERGWGARFTVAADYLRDQPALLGNSRLGPDLTNLGVRRPADETGTNLVWQLKHLYSAQLTTPGSTMPAYPFLFEKRPAKAVAAKTVGAFEVSTEPGYLIVPKAEALALVGYLASLHSDVSLFESPLPAPPKPAGDTNAPAGAAPNSPAK